MTEREAVNILQLNTPFVASKEANKAVDIAINALEKQIAKKPIYSDFDDNGYEEIIPYKAVCPTCGYEFEFGTWNDEHNHHCDCGQKLDWSEV